MLKGNREYSCLIKNRMILVMIIDLPIIDIY